MGRAVLAAVTAAVLAAFAGASRATVRAQAAPGCPAPRVSAASEARIDRVLASGRDVWGEQLLRAANGPTYAAARGFLPPLLYAVGHGGAPLTTSGVYYLPFTLPLSVGGPRGFGLHVADGSQVIVRRVGGPSVTVEVGARGSERFGSCLGRLQAPRLADGYLPLLEVGYRDAAGVRYTQESFVGRLPRERSLVSFIRVTADARSSATGGVVRLVSSTGRVIRLPVPRMEAVELDAAFTHDGARLARVGAAVYDSARADVTAFWQKALAVAPGFVVPDADVMDAERALLTDELSMTWRYSVGNVYEELSYVEALDVAQV
ncbi:MAG TPA: hypothetical protein VLK36_10050, partial [Gaiellaceae bacterium]|nr:hypothetical protein [Gaiellaceae bacterium]